LNGSELISKVVTGVQFIDGQELLRLIGVPLSAQSPPGCENIR
jgi:hypothetical protein